MIHSLNSSKGFGASNSLYIDCLLNDVANFVDLRRILSRNEKTLFKSLAPNFERKSYSSSGDGSSEPNTDTLNLTYCLKGNTPTMITAAEDQLKRLTVAINKLCFLGYIFNTQTVPQRYREGLHAGGAVEQFGGLKMNLRFYLRHPETGKGKLNGNNTEIFSPELLAREITWYKAPGDSDSTFSIWIASYPATTVKRFDKTIESLLKPSMESPVTTTGATPYPDIDALTQAHFRKVLGRDG